MIFFLGKLKKKEKKKLNKEIIHRERRFLLRRS
jgi:hypothetical protein